MQPISTASTVNSSLYEIAQMTRAGPAKCLGLSKTYGGLAPGMNGDVSVFDLNYKNMPSDPEND